VTQEIHVECCLETPKERPLARVMRWWDDMRVIKEIVCEDMNWIELTPITEMSRSYLNTEMNLWSDKK
jgi:hypothetical protein